MLKIIIASLILLAIAFLLLGIRLFFGKDFVKTHLEDSKALRAKGIGCYKQLEAEERLKKSIKNT